MSCCTSACRTSRSASTTSCTGPRWPPRSCPKRRSEALPRAPTPAARRPRPCNTVLLGRWEVAEEPLVHVADALELDRQVGVLVVDVGFRAGDALCQPVPVADRDELVLGAVPDLHRHGDVRHVEAPALDEREVVVHPTVDPLLDPEAGRLVEELRHLS